MKNQLVEVLKNDGVVALPTETVYGLAVSLNSGAAIRKLMKLKERGFGSGKVFTLVPEDKAAIQKYALIDSRAQKMINHFFPGELTLILPKNPNFKHFYFDHFDSIGIRIPKHPLFQEILPATGPLLLTSANKRGEDAAENSSELKINADYVVEGESGHHLPSTVVDLSGKQPKIIRRGQDFRKCLHLLGKYDNMQA